MNPARATGRPAPSDHRSRWTLFVIVGALVLATLAAYHNSFSGPFVGDDSSAIPQNPTVRHLWPLSVPLSPPYLTTVNNRPVLNFTFALNYAAGGYATGGYHAVNLVVHLLAGLTLFGLVRRTLLRPVLRDRFGSVAVPVAAVSALLWLLHPVQTESVTYIVQRAESLMGFLYLLTLYGSVRAAEAEPRHRHIWQAVSVIACALAMGTKEVAATAPVMVLLYDRTFVGGSFREAWRRHRWFYGALALTWLSFTPLILAGGRRDPSSGFGNGLPFWAYARTQFRAMAHYLKIAFWPHPLLVYYYEPGGAKNYIHVPVAPYLPLVLPLLAGTGLALWRWPVIGFIGAWFFGILAPTSLVPGAYDTMADRRLYLSLAAIIVPLVACAFRRVGWRSLPVFLVIAAALAFVTERRNRVYGSDVGLCRDQAVANPDDPVAHYNLGCALGHAHEPAAAAAEYRIALRLEPGYVEALSNLGGALLAEKQPAAALAYLEEAVRLSPGHLSARMNLGLALSELGRYADAALQYRSAARWHPDYAEAHDALGTVLRQAGRLDDGIGEFETALRVNPHLLAARYDLIVALREAGRFDEAEAQYRAAVRQMAADRAAH